MEKGKGQQRQAYWKLRYPIACMKSKSVDMFNVKVNLFDGVVVTCEVFKLVALLEMNVFFFRPGG